MSNKIRCFSNLTFVVDHQNICEDDEFMCDSGRCIHVHYVCDFKPDCVDASDEFCGMHIVYFKTDFRTLSLYKGTFVGLSYVFI
jgi:hypothetical protein